MNVRQKANRFAARLQEVLQQNLPNAIVWLDSVPSFCNCPALKIADGSGRVIKLTLQVPHSCPNYIAMEVRKRFKSA